MKNLQSKTFLKVLATLAMIWILGGFFYFKADTIDQRAFLEVNLFTLLDLFAFVLMFWVIFFKDLKQGINRLIFILLLTFKLVCLALLAIVLKRLENKSALAAGAGIGIMGAGPILAALFTQIIGIKEKVHSGTRI